MIFPTFLLMVLTLGLFLIIIIAVYFQIYKRNVNKILTTKDKAHSPMVPPYTVAIVFTLVFLLVAIVISYFVGYKAAYDGFENGLKQSELVYETFYAEVKEVNGQRVLVQGLDINDIDYRDEYTLEIYGETELTWHNTVISVSNLKEGHIISVLLAVPNGTVEVPNTIIDIVKIQLLSEEK